jgi:AraC family transcriptional regulator
LTLQDPTFTEEIILKLSGMVYFGNPVHSYEGWTEGNEIGKLWDRFTRICIENADELGKVTVEPGVAYEAHIAYAGEPNQEYHIFVGIETREPITYPIELFYKVMPASKYAVFTAKGHNMANQIETIYTEWLPNSLYVESYPMLIQRYDQKRFISLDDPESEIDFMVPIKERDYEG